MIRPTLDARQHSDAIRAAINAEFGKQIAFEQDDLPRNDQKLPPTYVIVTVSRTYNANLRVTAQAALTGWRVTTRAVDTTLRNAQLAQAKVAAALNEVSLLVADRRTTPIQFETGQSARSDDGRYSALDAWTYAL